MMNSSSYTVVFLGTPDFAVPTLQALAQQPQFKIIQVITQEDKPVGRKKILSATPVKLIAQNLNLPLAYNLQALENLKFDLGIVVAYGKIIPRKILSIPKYGFLNLHPSLLPKYRGPSPIQTALLNGDKITGISIMQLDAGMDTGPLLKQKVIPIHDQDTYASLSAKLSALGADLFINSIIPYLQGKLVPTAQKNSDQAVTRIIAREDGLISLQSPAQELFNKFRAFYPWPGIYLNYNGRRLKILEAKLNGDKFQILKVQLEGKKPLSVIEFERGYGKII